MVRVQAVLVVRVQAEAGLITQVVEAHKPIMVVVQVMAMPVGVLIVATKQVPVAVVVLEAWLGQQQMIQARLEGLENYSPILHLMESLDILLEVAAVVVIPLAVLVVLVEVALEAQVGEE